jgi:hypothetical protein
VSSQYLLDAVEIVRRAELRKKRWRDNSRPFCRNFNIESIIEINGVIEARRVLMVSLLLVV